MKKLKKILGIILILCILITSVSCAKNTNNNVNKDKLKIISTIFPYADFAKNICKDKADVKTLMAPGEEPHHFEPSPLQIIEIKECDLFLYTGGESDTWVESILDSMDASVKAVKMIDYITLRKADDENQDHEDHKEHENHEEYDEHIWTSLKNAEDLCDGIESEVQKTDDKNYEFYKENLSEYKSQLSSLDNEISDYIKGAKRNEIIMGDRFPFIYFFKDYNLKYSAAFPGCSSETEPSAETVATLSKKVKDENIPVVFYLELSNANIARTIAEGTNAKILMLHSCHNLTKDEYENNEDYLSLMKENILNLKEAL